MKNDKENEIDLIELFATLYRFILNKRWLLFFSIVIGVSIGIMNIISNPLKYRVSYKKDYIAYSPVVSKETLIEIFTYLEQRIGRTKIDEKNNLKLTSIDLNLPENIVKNLKEIHITEKFEDIEANGGLKFTLEIYNSEQFNKLIEGITYYVSTNKYVKERQEILLNQQAELISLFNHELVEFDSINKRNKIPDFLQNSNSHFINNIKSEELSYIGLIRQKQSIEREMQLNPSALQFITINSPIIYVSNKSAIISTVIIYGLFGLFTGLILGLFPILKMSFNSALLKK